MNIWDGSGRRWLFFGGGIGLVAGGLAGALSAGQLLLVSLGLTLLVASNWEVAGSRTQPQPGQESP